VQGHERNLQKVISHISGLASPKFWRGQNVLF